MSRKSLFSKVACILFAFCLLIAGARHAQSQTPTPTPESEEMKALRQTLERKELERKIAEADKGIAEANKAKTGAEFPKASATPLEGKTELDAGVKIETEMMAYRALGKAAEKVASEVNREAAGKKIAILNSQWLLGLRGYWAAFGQINLMRDGYEKILDQPAPQPLIGKINQPAAGSLVAKIGDGNAWTAFNSELKVSSNITTSGIKSSATGVLSFLGAAGSIVGAAIDLMALLRTDTKITGSSFIVSDSAFVAAVYRGLKDKSATTTLYYPGEFPPNINLRKKYAILGELNRLNDLKTRAEAIATEIEEIEKAYKEAAATKAALEARQKHLPDEIAAARSKLTALETGFPIPTRRPREVISDIEDLNAKLKDLKKESEALSKKIENNDKAIREFGVRLARLYGEIRPIAAREELINAFIDIGAELDAKSSVALRRSFTFEEAKTIAEPTEASKKRLFAAWKSELSARYMEATAESLFEVYDRERLKIFVRIGEQLRQNGGALERLDPRDFLTEEEQFKLLYETDAQATAEKNIRDKSKAVQIVRLKTLNKQFDKFFEDIAKVDPAIGFSPFAAYLQTENLMEALGCKVEEGRCDDAYALVLGVIDVGGNNRTKKNLVTMVATGADITHSGGAIVTYKLYDMTGDIKTSSICRAYESYTKAKNINRSDKDPRSKAVCDLLPENQTDDAQTTNDGADPEGAKETRIRKPPRIRDQ